VAGDVFFLLLLNMQRHAIQNGNVVSTEVNEMRFLRRKKQRSQIWLPTVYLA